MPTGQRRAGTDSNRAGYPPSMTEQESEQKKVGLTIVRIPLLVLGALVVMLVIGVMVIG